MGDLSNGFTDIGWANLFIRDDRRAIMDFTDTYSFHFTTFLVRKPQALPMWTAPIQPYGSVMWGACFITGIFIICFIMFIVWLRGDTQYKACGLKF